MARLTRYVSIDVGDKYKKLNLLKIIVIAATGKTCHQRSWSSLNVSKLIQMSPGSLTAPDAAPVIGPPP